MKKLLALLLLSPLANADMDKICSVVLSNTGKSVTAQIGAYNCERNNILLITSTKAPIKGTTKREQLLLESTKWCRLDRNRKIESDLLSCVLYSNKPRNYKFK